MGYQIPLRVDGARIVVDGRDVATWHGRRSPVDTRDEDAEDLAALYVNAHPRPADAAGRAATQRLALLRLLAAGPAARVELLAALRTAGWVGGSDLENRLRELRPGGQRAGAAAGLALAGRGDRFWLEEPFPVLEDEQRRALGFAKAMLRRVAGPLARRAEVALDHLVPGVRAGHTRPAEVQHLASVREYIRFDEALIEARPVRVRYWSVNSGRERTFTLVPSEYATLGPTVKVLCVPVDREGRRAGEDLQLTHDRLLTVEPLPDWPAPEPSEIALRRHELVMTVDDGLYRVMTKRHVLGVDEARAEQSPHDDSWRVTGTFPAALAWDVMEQLAGWAGQMQVHEPLWLVNAVVRRLRAGLEVMEAGAAFTLVKPEPQRTFSDHADAISAEDPMPPPSGPRRLPPRDFD